MNLEYLIKVLWNKRNAKALNEAIEEAQEQEDEILSLEDLKSIMGVKEYNKLLKGFEF